MTSGSRRRPGPPREELGGRPRLGSRTATIRVPVRRRAARDASWGPPATSDSLLARANVEAGVESGEGGVEAGRADHGIQDGAAVFGRQPGHGVPARADVAVKDRPCTIGSGGVQSNAVHAAGRSGGHELAVGGPCGQGAHVEAGMGVDDVERLPADRPGRAEQGDTKPTR